MKTIMLIFILLVVTTYSQQFGSIKQNTLLPLEVTENGIRKTMHIVLDANWHWVHAKNSMENCFQNGWVKKFCPSSEECTQNCVLEGIEKEDYLKSYGISVNGNALTLRYVTSHTYGKNIGSRVYLMDETAKQYKGFDFTNSEFEFTADISRIPCGLNAAIYSVEMPLNGGLNKWNTAGAPFGTGYGDAQCAKDITWVGGLANLNQTGACSIEMDFWEANRMATALTPHPCSTSGVQSCFDSKSCGESSNRYNGICDKDGADYNPYRLGNRTLYGPNLEIDTLKPFQVITQIFTDRIVRFYQQNGKRYFGGELNDQLIRDRKSKFGEQNHYAKLGGWKKMIESFKRKHVLAISLWDDLSASMLWLDSTFPKGSNQPGSIRGPCSGSENDALQLREKEPNAFVTYSNFKFTALSLQQTTKVPSTTVPVSDCFICTKCRVP